MQMAKPVSMVVTKLFIIMQLFANLEYNNILKAGCKWLSKANWKQLNSICFCNS